MGDKPARAMGGSCLGGIVGAVLGIAIGGFIGPVIAKSNNDLRNNPDPAAKQLSGLFDGCFGFFGLLLGVSIGGVVGGIGGSVLGAGLAMQDSGRPTPQSPSSQYVRLAGLSEPFPESPELELARLKERIAELEGKKLPEGPLDET